MDTRLRLDQACLTDEIKISEGKDGLYHFLNSESLINFFFYKTLPEKSSNYRVIN